MPVMTKYYFVIKSTIDIKDHSDNIKVGDNLYNTDEVKLYDTFDQAMDAGHELLSGLNGGRAYNKALETCEIYVEEQAVENKKDE